MRRAPARPVRALCEPVAWLLSKNMTCATLVQCNAKQTLSSHFTPRTSHFTLALHTPHFISSQIMWALLASSHLISSNPISSHMSSRQVRLNCFHLIRARVNPFEHGSTFLISSNAFAHRSLRHRCIYIKKPLQNTLYYKLAQSTSQYYFVLQSLREVLPSTTLYYQLAQNTSQYYFVLQSLHKARPSTTLHYKVCTKHFPVQLCTTKLAACFTKHAQSTFQYYFVLQSLRKAHLSTTSYYKFCTKHFPVLLCPTNLAQSTSQYYFVLQSLHKALPSTTKIAQSTSQDYCVLQSLHKALPSTTYFVLQSLHKIRASTTLYYKACTKYFPVLLCTTKLAQSTSQSYFVLQSLHKVLPCTTLYYKACTKYSPRLLCTTKLVRSTSQR